MLAVCVQQDVGNVALRCQTAHTGKCCICLLNRVGERMLKLLREIACQIVAFEARFKYRCKLLKRPLKCS